MKLGAVIVLLSLSALLSCQSAPQKADQELAMQSQLPALLAPNLLHHSVQVHQQVQFQQSGKLRQLLVVWSLDNTVLQLVGLSVQGQRLFSLRLDNEHYSEQAYVQLPEGFSPRRLLQELQWAYWPEDAIVGSFSGFDLRFVKAAHQRQILGANGFEIRYQFDDTRFPESLTLTHSQGYELRITTLSVTPISPASKSEESQ